MRKSSKPFKVDDIDEGDYLVWEDYFKKHDEEEARPHIYYYAIEEFCYNDDYDTYEIASYIMGEDFKYEREWEEEDDVRPYLRYPRNDHEKDMLDILKQKELV